MARKRNPATNAEPEGGATLRRCIGSKRYGIEAHDAPVEDFPAQPSQKNGLGRMCKPHWRQYTAALARHAKARRAAAEAEAPASGQAEPPAEAPKRSRKRDVARVPAEQADAD